jgi:hypothetical protein
LVSRINYEDLAKKQANYEKMCEHELTQSQQRFSGGSGGNFMNTGNGSESGNGGGGNAEVNDIKKNMIIEEFLGQKQDDPWKMYIREFMTGNGQLRVPKQGIETISPLVLNVEMLKGLDLSDNKIAVLPDFLPKLSNLTFLSLKNNQLKNFELNGILTMAYLGDLDLSGNKLTQLFMNVSRPQQEAMQSNMLMLRSVNVSKNSIRRVPYGLVFFENLNRVDLSFNQIDDVCDLFVDGYLERLDTVDLGNNKIRELPDNIWRWVNLVSLNVENNEIKNFNPEIGFLNLSHFNIMGNPSILVRNAILRRGVPATLAYLKEKHTNGYALDQEINQIIDALDDRPEKQYKKVEVEWEFDDPFKRKAVGLKKAPEYGNQGENRGSGGESYGRDSQVSNQYDANNYAGGSGNRKDSA